MSHVILSDYPFIALSQLELCVQHTTMHQFTVSLHSRPHRQGACVFSCNLPLALLAEWPGSFTCCCSNMWVERIFKQEPA